MHTSELRQGVSAVDLVSKFSEDVSWWYGWDSSWRQQTGAQPTELHVSRWQCTENSREDFNSLKVANRITFYKQETQSCTDQISVLTDLKELGRQM